MPPPRPPAAKAEDLVQGFFAHLIRLDGLRLADPDRSRFRAFLLGGLKHHLPNQGGNANTA